jgi:uncharacterized SAM-binding protein YcdF (DUF218 family)
MHIEELAKIIWDYHHMNHELVQSDCILVLGSHDTRVAERGAKLFLAGWAPWIVFSGGLGRLTEGMWDQPEADKFAEIAVSMGVPRDKIVIENRSTNTGENIIFTKQRLEETGIEAGRFIVVQKPYMERRAYATFKKVWPEKEAIVTSPQMTFEEYSSENHEGITKEQIIHIMVGDLQRIKLYPEKGFQIPQEIPDDVWNAYEQLVQLGYTSHLIR